MIIDVNDIRTSEESRFDLYENFEVSKDLLDNANILKLNNLLIDGTIELYNNKEYYLDIVLSGTMVLPCAMTLKPVNHDFEVNICGDIMNMLKEIDEKVEKIENTIDIFPILWENILMEIPLRVVSDESKDMSLSGNGWRLITEQEEKTNTNPELEKLKDLLKKEV